MSDRNLIRKLQHESVFKFIELFLVVDFIPIGKQAAEIVKEFPVQSPLDSGQVGGFERRLPEFLGRFADFTGCLDSF